MIEPTKDDIGREVVYTGNRYKGGELEYGTITGFNAGTVWVRYHGTRGDGQGTNRQDLDWAHIVAAKDEAAR